SGLLERESRQIPFSRIHNVSLQQTLLHRLFGVAAVKLESAGGTRPEAEMKVLRYAEALALERLIRHRGAADIADGRDAGTVDDTDTHAQGETLLALPVGEIVRLGLISNRGMVVITAAFALAWQVFPEGHVIDMLRGAWQGVVGYTGLDRGDTAALGLTALGLLALALALVRVLSVV